ncbi:MAG: UDP-N-acetylmuramoyl-L-alanyl-D-glutamate--2,6-diaminopimelate ligase [Saprospiraceae bacterium]|nr:UDP-N-acetylmuramoyl-L-alanyl-D-glutamate--2,6-diaminopimelate ligase [Saprospiraceae bacterium]MDW8229789.1 UDP-N-acetylmuramoyl-L-alanyl-D-glutamate--2,6-diaminopimelate ligase [Saprospiraceae bacterium]
MLLETLLNRVPGVQMAVHTADTEVRAIQADSRRVEAGDCFVAVRGVSADGHQFIGQALERGAVAVVAEYWPEGLERPPLLAFVTVQNAAEALGHLASAFYGYPSHSMRVVGVTGTNGKTTTTTLMHQLFTALGRKAGLVGTVENRIGQQVMPSALTTPDAVSLHALLRQMADAGCTEVFMEASSHAIHQRRIAGVHFAGAVFTNLTHDHLDYHGTFANYRNAKKQLFDDLPPSAFALTNADDRNGAFMLQNTHARRYTYALKTPADFKARVLDNALTGLHLEIDGVQLHTRLVGAFNAYNLTAAYAVASLLGIEKETVLTALSNLTGAEGRFEILRDNSQPPRIGIVDYAHTPDALQNVLETIRQLRRHPARIFTVVGCGGNRDRAKRPLMAQIAARMSDHAILTSDNPRTEDPRAILQDMEAGLTSDDLNHTLTIENREQAIKTACLMAKPGDIILVAGKGHEKYQEINGVKHAFDDKLVLQQYLTGQSSGHAAGKSASSDSKEQKRAVGEDADSNYTKEK